MNLEIAIQSLELRPAAYLLQGVGGDYIYKGACRNLLKRMKDHKAGRVSKTKNKRPLILLHHEYCEDYSAALKREKYFKSGVGRKWVKENLII